MDEKRKKELIEEVLESVDFDKLYKVYEMYKETNPFTGVDTYPDLHLSGTYQIGMRKMSPKTLREDAYETLEMLFDLTPDEFESTSCGHGGFSSQVEWFEGDEITNISLTVTLICQN